jgi:hypothetical protein
MFMYNQDFPYVLKPPRVVTGLSENIWRLVTASLATFNDVTAAAVRRQISRKTPIIQYRRVSHLDGGDSMRCIDLVPLGSGDRDTSFVQVS